MKLLSLLSIILCCLFINELPAQKLVDNDIIGNYFGTNQYFWFKRTIIETDNHLIIGKDHKIKRYDKTGELDESFGENGLLSLGDSVQRIHGVFLTEEHLIVIAQLRFDGFQFKLKYLLYDKEGQQLQFSRIHEIAEHYELFDVLLLKDKKILLIGRLWNRSIEERDYLAMRLTSQGKIDTTFQLRLPLRGQYNKNCSRVFMAAIQREDGKLLLTERGNCEAHLRLYNLDGTIDNSFGKKGKVLIPTKHAPDIRNIHLLPNKILVTGGLISHLFMARFSENGVLDTTFADKGIAGHLNEVPAPDEYWHTSIIEPDGKILLLGNTDDVEVEKWEYRKGLLARYHADGSVDKTFMDNGTFYLEGFKSSNFLYATPTEKGYKLLISESLDERERGIGSLYMMDLEIEVSTATVEQSKNASHQLYPIPVSDAFTLTYQLEEAGKVEIELLDISGQVLKMLLAETQAIGNHTKIFNLAGFPKGAYYLHLNSNGQQDIIKLMIQ